MSTTMMLIYGLCFLMVITIFLVIRMELRLKKLFKGAKGADLESLMREVVARTKALTEVCTHHEDDIVQLQERLAKQGHAVKLVRFNPFPDVGGSQSFAVAIVNESGDGVVLSSLYSRERMSVFAKPVAKGKSDIDLSEEEAHVITEAQKLAQQQ